MTRTSFWIAAALASLLLGCRGRPAPDLASSDPTRKVPAIKAAVRAGDSQAARQLVHDLRSDDPAVRFYAIQGLRRLSGENLGYSYYDEPADREAAVQRWERWLEQQTSDDSAEPATSPATMPREW